MSWDQLLVSDTVNGSVHVRSHAEFQGGKMTDLHRRSFRPAGLALRAAHRSRPSSSTAHLVA